MPSIEKTQVLPAISDYELIDVIGQGGIAEIYKARQKSLDRTVAIKMIFPEWMKDPEIVHRFHREAITIAGLNHPNIVHVIDKGEVGGRYYFVMEYVDGTSFKEILYDGKIPIREKLEIMIGTLKGLDYAHKNGVIHRDIKPANILIDKNRNALLADFGIAQILHKSDYEHTRPDIVMGTLAYMSPEQRESSSRIDHTSDIYAVGVMIYEILTGKRPAGRFQLPSELNPKLPKRFDALVSRCLDENPSGRYQSAGALKDDLLNILMGSGPGSATFKKEMAGVEALIGKCRYLDTIRSTKYSSTVLVENMETHEPYVIKKTDNSAAGLREARLLANLKHAHIVHIFGAGGDARKMIVMMEYAAGGSLADRMVRPYPYDKAMPVIVPIAKALDFAHKNNIIHGNLRPTNVLFMQDDTIKVTDFGLPPHYDMDEKNWYVPPERSISRQADVYAMGVILCQLLTGGYPVYDREKHLNLGELTRTNPEPINQMLLKLLAVRLPERYRAIGDFLQDWQAYEDDKKEDVSRQEHHHTEAKTRSKGLVGKIKDLID